MDKGLLVSTPTMNLYKNFPTKSLKEVMECEGKFINHVKVEPQKVVAMVLQRIWSLFI